MRPKGDGKEVKRSRYLYKYDDLNNKIVHDFKSVKKVAFSQ